ncbi:MAG TPA: hypothetical protein VNM90_03110 [Haliangium sp.]|nr:hypothetical protein [Haliangium sp.]
MRTIFSVIVIGALLYFCATVKLGERTFFGHIKNIWAADETQDMVEGIKESSGPMVDRVQRGVKAGFEEARRPEDAGVPDAEPPQRRGRSARDR